uniref:Uncharacterized protein n=1 Tax=Noccaea caerulescens TaxID=107243 RepID=A0A1J3D6Z9_NOCCA
MPGNHGEISLDDQSGGDNDNNKARRRKKKKKDDAKEVGIADGFEDRNQSVMPSISKPRKRFIDRIRKKPKSPKRSSSSSSSSSRSGSRKGGCFSVMRPRRREEDGDSSPTSDPNDESFTHEMLKVMLETNDFCSDECNPHR